MHKKLAKDGLVILAVNTDDPKDKKTRDNVIGVLQKTMHEKLAKDDPPPFPTANLNIEAEEYQKRFKVAGWPCVYVFNRDNLYVKKLPLWKGDDLIEDVDYDVIDKVVEEQLKKK